MKLVSWVIDNIFGESTILATISAIGIAFVLGLGVGTYGGYSWADMQWTVAAEKQKNEASQLYAKLLTDKQVIVKAYGDLKNSYDAKTIESIQRISNERAKVDSANRSLNDLLIRLREQGYGAGCTGTGSGKASSSCYSSDLPTTVRKLSVAVGTLADRGAELARGADQDRAVATICSAWVKDMLLVK